MTIITFRRMSPSATSTASSATTSSSSATPSAATTSSRRAIILAEPRSWRSIILLDVWRTTRRRRTIVGRKVRMWRAEHTRMRWSHELRRRRPHELWRWHATRPAKHLRWTHHHAGRHIRWHRSRSRLRTAHHAVRTVGHPFGWRWPRSIGHHVRRHLIRYWRPGSKRSRRKSGRRWYHHGRLFWHLGWLHWRRRFWLSGWSSRWIAFGLWPRPVFVR